MDVVLQRHGAQYIYRVPEGLHELMSDISREVLREQPTDICEFIANYLDAMLISRENIKCSLEIYDEIVECAELTASFLNKTTITKNEADVKARIIQRAFRNYLSRKKFDSVTIDEAKELVQTASAELQTIFGALGITKESAEAAAIKIQAAYRGYRIRRESNFSAKNYLMKQIKNKAALAIQTAYRKHMRKKKVQVNDDEVTIIDTQNVEEEEGGNLIQLRASTSDQSFEEAMYDEELQFEEDTYQDLEGYDISEDTV